MADRKREPGQGWKQAGARTSESGSLGGIGDGSVCHVTFPGSCCISYTERAFSEFFLDLQWLKCPIN